MPSAPMTEHPTAGWTLQQFREALPSDHNYRLLIHDRDSIFSTEVDDELKSFGLTVLRTPVQAPKANAFCERLIGTVRRECLDYVIPLSEKHLRKTRREWVSHYNHGRPHSAFGPGIPVDTKARLRRSSVAESAGGSRQVRSRARAPRQTQAVAFPRRDVRAGRRNDRGSRRSRRRSRAALGDSASLPRRRR